MKKLCISIVILLIILVGGMPFGMGFVIKNQYEKLLAQVPASDDFQVRLVSYHRGWFTSKAKVEATIELPPTKTEPNRSIKLVSTDVLEHGPVLWDSSKTEGHFWMLGQSFVRTSLQVVSGLPESLKDKVVISGLTHVKLDGAMLTTLKGNPITYMDPKGEATVDWKGLVGSWKTDGAFTSVKGNLHLLGVDVNAKQANVNFSGINLRYNEEKSKDGFWLGENSVLVPMLSLVENNQQVFLLKGLHLDIASHQKGDFIASKLLLKFADLQLKDKHYGPAVLKANSDNLDAKAVAKLNALAQEINEHSQGKPTAEQQSELMQAIVTVLGKGASIAVEKLEINTSKGLIDGHSQLHFAPIPKGQEASLPQLMQTVAFSADLAVPTSIVEDALGQMEKRHAVAMALMAQSNNGGNSAQQVPDAKQKLAAWMELGFIQKVDGRYRVTVNFEKGQWMINGKTVAELMQQAQTLQQQAMPAAAPVTAKPAPAKKSMAKPVKDEKSAVKANAKTN